MVYNTGTADDGLQFDGREKAAPLGIPVIYVKKDIAKKYFADESTTVEIKLKIVFTEKKRTGHNVAAYIDNSAATTITPNSTVVSADPDEGERLKFHGLSERNSDIFAR